MVFYDLRNSNNNNNNNSNNNNNNNDNNDNNNNNVQTQSLDSSKQFFVRTFRPGLCRSSSTFGKQILPYGC